MTERLFTPRFLRDFRINNLEYLHVKKICGKIPDGGISIPAGETVEISNGYVRNFNSSKFPNEYFTSKFELAPRTSDLIGTIKIQILCGERSYLNDRDT